MKTATKERPIIFSTPEIRAILDGRKTQTRRVIKPQPQISSASDASWRDAKADLWRNSRQYARDCCPYGQVGDVLWVREKFCIVSGPRGPLDNPSIEYFEPRDRCNLMLSDGGKYHRQGTGEFAARGFQIEKAACNDGWRSPIHMPRWASRITLELTDVRVERLQEITGKDIAAEGFPFSSDIDQYKLLWNNLNASRGYSWESNPYVWVLTFKRIEESA